MFRGRPLEERTEYTYDAQGRLATARTFREAPWSDEDRAEAMALAMHETGQCPCGCGFPAQTAWDDDNDGYFEADENPVVCYARAAAEQWSKDYPPDKRPLGVIRPRVRFTREEASST